MNLAKWQSPPPWGGRGSCRAWGGRGGSGGAPPSRNRRPPGSAPLGRATTPSAKWRYRMVKKCVSLGEFDPSCQFHLAGGGGRAVTKSLTPAFFWPSANWLLLAGGAGI